jgi:hypothetical protein
VTLVAPGLRFYTRVVIERWPSLIYSSAVWERLNPSYLLGRMTEELLLPGEPSRNKRHEAYR